MMKQNYSLQITLGAALLFGCVLPAVAAAVPQAVTAPQTAKISLNKADAKALQQIKGMSAYKAHAIVAYRKQNGDFKTMDDLVKVKGFKRMKPDGLKQFTEQLQLD